MKGPRMDSVGGVAFCQSRKIINKFNLNTENNGLINFCHNLPYSSCGRQHGDGSIEKYECVATSIYPVAAKGNMARKQKNIKNWKTLNLKYFSADKKTPSRVGRRHFVTEYENNEKNHGILIDSDPIGEIDRETAIVCHCGNRCRRNCEPEEKGEKWKQCRNEERKASPRPRHLLNDGPDSDERGLVYKILPAPFTNCFVAEDGNRKPHDRNVCDEYLMQKELLTNNVLHTLLNIRTGEEIESDCSCAPRVLIPKHVYCLNHKSRKRRSDDGGPYLRTSPVHGSVESKPTNREKLELPEMAGRKTKIVESQDAEATVLKPKVAAFSEPSYSAGDRSRLERKTTVLPDDRIETNYMSFDKDARDGSSKFVPEIKYYEGSLNIFGGDDKKESPFLKITKTVTFEKERRVTPTGKILGIDSWSQTDDDEKEFDLSYGNSNCFKKSIYIPSPTSNDSLVDSAKVCGECLKFHASKYKGGRLVQENRANPEPGKLQCAPLDKSTSIDKWGPHVIGMELIKNDFVRFIAELFLEAIPKEMYNRIMGGSVRSNNEEYEVRVKSYDRNSTESCNLQTCKMRNLDSESGGVSQKGMKIERAGGTSRNECTTSDPKSAAGSGQPKKPSTNADAMGSSRTSKSILGPPKKEEGNTYDCQITLNGQKISVKVNKSVEDLFLSGNIRNVLHISPNEKTKLSTSPENEATIRDNAGKTKMAGNCTCAEDINIGRKESARRKNGVIKEDASGTQRSSAYGGLKRGDSFTAIETENFQKKPSKNSAGTRRNTKPLLTSPPPYGSVGRKTDKLPSVVFDNAENLYWSNIFNNVDGGNDPFSKTKMVKSSDYDSHNRMRSRVEYPYRVFANRRQSRIGDKSKRYPGSGTEKQVKECLPLYWESQYLKYCDQILSEGGGCTQKVDNCTSNVRNGARNNFVHGIEKQVMVTPTFGQCNVVDATRPLCIIKIAENENCENSQYRDYTVANLTSMKLNTNPFDTSTITCRKCIETLQSCSQSTGVNCAEDRQLGIHRDVHLYNYYCNSVTGKRPEEFAYSKGVKGGNRSSTKSDAIFRSKETRNLSPAPSDSPTGAHGRSPSYCCLNVQCYPNKEPQTPWISNEKQFLDCNASSSKVSHPELHGICFSVSRVVRNRDSSVDPSTDAAPDDRPAESKAQQNGVSTGDGNSRKKTEIEAEAKTSFTQTNGNCHECDTRAAAGKQCSCMRLSILRKSSTGGFDSTSDPGDRKTERIETKTVPPADYSAAETPKTEEASEKIKAGVNIRAFPTNDGISRSGDSAEVQDGGKAAVKPVVRKKSIFNKSRNLRWWRLWWFKRNGNGTNSTRSV